MNQFVHVVTLQPNEFEAEAGLCNVFTLLSLIEINFVIALSGDGLSLGGLECLRNHQFRGTQRRKVVF